MPISRRAWLLGTAGAVLGAAGLVSIPGGGPRTYVGGIPPQTDFAPFGTIYSPDELRSELNWLVATMRDVGARPFAYVSEAVFDRAHRATLARLDRPMRAGGLFLHAARLFATLRDGHVAILLGREYDLWRGEHNGRAFPLQLAFTPFGPIVDVPTHAAFPRGTAIEAIDGVPAAAVTAALVALQGAQTPRLALEFARTYTLRQSFYARDGEVASFTVEGRRPDGTFVRERVRATTSPEVQKALDADAALRHAQADYTFARIAGGRVGYIDYRHCNDYDAFGRFLRATFADIARQGVDGVVIDIRRNGGGESRLNAKLWQYVTTKPFSDGGMISSKVSARLKREYGFAKYNLRYLGPAWFMPDGSTMTFDYSGIATIRPGNDPLRYHGPVYLLIGVGTFSSALDCAQEAKDYGLATLVGQETGEPLDTTGQAYDGYSPRVGLQFQFTTRYSWFPGHPKGRGVIPDVTIVPTAADLRLGRDPVLDYAVRAIAQRRAGGS